jgi:hypothetical protein
MAARWLLLRAFRTVTLAAFNTSMKTRDQLLIEAVLALWQQKCREFCWLAACKTLARRMKTRMQPFEYRSVR